MTYEEARRRLHYAIDYDDLRPSVKEAIGIILSDCRLKRDAMDKLGWKALEDCVIRLREQERDMRLGTNSSLLEKKTSPAENDGAVQT